MRARRTGSLHCGHTCWLQRGPGDADDSHPRRARSRLDGRYHLTRSSGRGPAPVTIARGSRYSLSAIGGERDDDPAEPGPAPAPAPALTAQPPGFASAHHKWTHAGPGSSLFGLFFPLCLPPLPGQAPESDRPGDANSGAKNKNANAPAPPTRALPVLRFPCLLAVVSAWVAATLLVVEIQQTAGPCSLGERRRGGGPTMGKHGRPERVPAAL